MNYAIFKYNNLTLSLLKKCSRIEFTKEMISFTIITKFGHLITLSIKKQLILKLKKFFESFKILIWNFKCKIINQYKLSNSITAFRKKDYICNQTTIIYQQLNMQLTS
jgi:hypothetical protein